MVLIYKLNSSGRGQFIVPHSNGRRTSYLNTQSLSTNGKGLLLSKGLGATDYRSTLVAGSGLAVETSRVARSATSAGSADLSSLRSRLSSLSVGRGVAAGKKKKFISLKL